MNNPTVRRRMILVLLLCSFLPAIAEVSVDPTGVIVFGIFTEGPDPVGIWIPYRAASPDRLLNISGDARGDGVPDLTFKTIGGAVDPVGVWAYNAGSDHDVAYSEWDGNQWTPVEFLTSTIDDELDPRLVVESDGTVHVVWWTAGPTNEIYLATRPAGTTNWDPIVLVTAGTEEGRRPSVVIDGTDLRVAYERDSTVGGMAQDIVVATKQTGGLFSIELVGSTTRVERLDAIVHSEGASLWVDWMHDAGEFGCAEFQENIWSLVAPEPWTDPSWLGVEGMRKQIRSRILSP